MEMFDILNDMEDAPATLLSANRHLICKCDARLLVQSEGAVKTIHKLEHYLFSLLLFTDMIVVSVNLILFGHVLLIFTHFLQLCKKRTSIRRSNSLRERSSSVLKKARKSYKFIETIDFSMLREIYTEFDENGKKRSLALTFVLKNLFYLQN